MLTRFFCFKKTLILKILAKFYNMFTLKKNA